MVGGGLLRAGQYPAVTQDRAETRDVENENKGGVPIPPSNHSFKVKSKER